MKRRNESLYKVAADASKFAERYNKDPMQQKLLAGLIHQALGVVEWWREAFTACEAGEVLNFTLSEVPRVFPLEN